MLLLVSINRYGIDEVSDKLDCVFCSLRAVERVTAIVLDPGQCTIMSKFVANNHIMHCFELIAVNGIQYDVYSMNLLGENAQGVCIGWGISRCEVSNVFFILG